MTHGNNFWTDANVDRLKALAAEGLSDSAIASKLGCTRNMVIGKRSRLGGTRDGKKPSKGRKRTPAINITPAAPVIRTRNSIGTLAPLTSKLRTVDVERRNLSFEELKRNDCRYPEGDPPTFCGLPTAEGSSYCPAHQALCGQSPAPRKY